MSIRDTRTKTSILELYHCEQNFEYLLTKNENRYKSVPKTLFRYVRLGYLGRF